MKKLIEILAGLIDNKFYGSIKINFQNGKIVNCVKEESFKLSE